MKLTDDELEQKVRDLCERAEFKAYWKPPGARREQMTEYFMGAWDGYRSAEAEVRAQVRAEVWEEAAKELDLSADHFLNQDKHPAWDRTRAEGISTPGYAGSALRQMAVNFRAKEKA